MIAPSQTQELHSRACAASDQVPDDILRSMARSVTLERERLASEQAELIEKLILAWAAEKLRNRDLEMRLLAAIGGACQ